MDALLGIAVGQSTARMPLIEGAEGPPTIFRSPSVRPVEPTRVGPVVHAAMAPTRSGPIVHVDTPPTLFGPVVHADIAHTRFAPIANPRTGPFTNAGTGSFENPRTGPFENPRTGPFAANTRLASAPPPPAPAAPQLAYSMTGNIAALTDYVEAYQSGPNDFYEAQAAYDIDPDAADPDLDDSPESAPERPAKRSSLLVGSIAVVFMAIAISILTTSVVISVRPTADEKPVISSQQPVLAPLATRISASPVATPAAPVPPPPPPPVVVPPPPPPPVITQAPKPRVVQRQAPPRVTQAPPQEDAPPPRVTQTQPRSRFTPGGPPDEGPLPDEGDGPPPREAPRHRDPFTPSGPPPHDGGGLFPARSGCLPLLPC